MHMFMHVLNRLLLSIPDHRHSYNSSPEWSPGRTSGGITPPRIPYRKPCRQHYPHPNISFLISTRFLMAI